ncbi:phage holin family protein [Fodinicurvata sp. EGI_FJ10296]|uniref:phage holin family protein n=1 Tax=Fodinicurvata sp. EGI_FJ10296 TaxID=3231908 RepID=UPI0034516B6C
MNTGKNLPELFSDMVEHLSTLFLKEVRLAKTEASEKVHQATGAIVYAAMGGLILLAGFLVLLDSAVAWLVEFGLDIEWSTLAVGLVVALIGFILLRKGMNDIKAASLTPKRTVAQLRSDGRAAREQF